MKSQLLQIVLLSTIICSSCISQEHNLIKKIEYFASTRESSIHVIVFPDHLIYNDSISKITSKKWDAIYLLIDEINLTEISKLQAPSEDRFRDAALAAEIKITTSETTYTSSQFDHGKPPKEIKKLVQQMLSLVEL